MNELDDIQALIRSLDTAHADLHSTFSALDHANINRATEEGSWTPAQVLDHVTRSNRAMALALRKPGKPAQRDPAAKAEQLRTSMRDLSKKRRAPDFIIPSDGPFEKEAVLDNLSKSFAAITELARNGNHREIVEGLPFGEVTRLEVLHFIVHHTERHTQQLRNLAAALRAGS